MFDVKNLASISVGLASPERIRSWSHGEITKAETINYRSQKPEPDGLFCEKVFGPSKDYECHCGKYKKIKDAGRVCEKCGVEVISKDVRRERMGHIELVSPCTHIWYLKGIPSRIGLILDIPPKQVEEVVYFISHLCLNPGTSKVLKYRQFLDEKTAREIFVATIQEILPNIDPESADYENAQTYIENLSNEHEAFDFLTVSKFISKYTGAEFGEGAEAIKRLLKEVDLDKDFAEVSAEVANSTGQKRAKYIKRLEAINAFRNSNNRPEWMVLDVIPVIPPDLRPMLQLDGGRFAASDLNDLYRRVITRNARLKKMIDLNAPNVILMNGRRMLQEAVDALIDNGRRNKPVQGSSGRALKSLSSSLKGKQGRFRQNLLGKRVDYSGRSVIAVGPDLKMYQCGLPREMAIQLLKPYIINILINRGIATAHKTAEECIDHYQPVVFDIVEEIIGDHPVLLNRAPTLHRLGIQAFQPKLVEGRAIRLHPLVCAGFNADFDGDQMAVHLPLSKAAQQEALELMLASNNILGPKDGKPIVTPSQDMVLGNYYLTLEETKENLLARAGRRKAKGDLEEYELFTIYGNAEGKVYRSIDEVIMAYQTKQAHLHTRIAIRGSSLNKTGFTEKMNHSYLLTTVGKVIFNLIFPADFPYLNSPDKRNLKADLDEFFVPFGSNIKEEIAKREVIAPFKKKDLANIIDEIYHRYGTSKTSAVLDKMKDQGFKYSTCAGFTISFTDVPILKNKEEIIAKGDKEVAVLNKLYNKGLLTEEEHHKEVCDVWNNVKGEITNKLSAQFEQDKRNPIFMMQDSGARGSIGNLTQLSGIRGLMQSPKGETIELPIKSCFREGMTVGEYFIGTHGARKGGADTALKTADSGYLTRRLVDVSQDVIVREEDCHTDHGFKVSAIVDHVKNIIIVPLYDRLVGRFSLHDIVNPSTGEVIVASNTMIDELKAKEIEAAGIKEVEIRSLFGCETKNGVCVHCYGRNLATGKVVSLGEAVGIMAAQSIGEPGTQLTMRTFNTGGVAGSDITSGLPRVQELVEARNPKGEALISEIAGKVTKIEENNGKYTFTVTNDLEEKEFVSAFGAHACVKVGDEVKSGEKLTIGAIAPKKLLEVSTIVDVENYMLKEIQKVYREQSISISDKHLEVIIRQMLKKILVIDNGDTDLIPGTRIDIDEFSKKNEDALIEGKRPATGKILILGITKAALETKSFLSAASFQETTRVLTDASIKAKNDPLHGLKENVITGKLIPAGEGLLSEEEATEHLKDFSVAEKMKEVKQQYIEAHDRPDETE